MIHGRKRPGDPQTTVLLSFGLAGRLFALARWGIEPPEIETI